MPVPQLLTSRMASKLWVQTSKPGTTRCSNPWNGLASGDVHIWACSCIQGFQYTLSFGSSLGLLAPAVAQEGYIQHSFSQREPLSLSTPAAQNGRWVGGENISGRAAQHFQLLIDHEMILSVHVVLQGSGHERLDVITAHEAWLPLVFPWLFQGHHVTQATDAIWPDEATPIFCSSLLRVCDS